jgi:hypothetical protein
MLSTNAVRTAAVGLALGAAMTGCKSNKTVAAPSAAAPVRSSAAVAPTPAAAAASPTTASALASGAAGAKSCPAGHTAAIIGGASKCLAPGQECSSKHVDDYTQYGFTCEQTGARYVLKRKA